MDRLVKCFSWINKDDDRVDRLSRLYTVTILVIIAIAVGLNQYLGRPISCWCPAQFTDSHRDFADATCWASNTYFLLREDVIPEVTVSQQRSIQLTSYYHWVPLILISQGLIAFLPCLIWRFLHRRSRVNITAIMDAAKVCSQASYLDKRDKAIGYAVDQIKRFLQRESHTGLSLMANVRLVIAKIFCLCTGELYNNYLISCYLATKLLYAASAIAQIILLNNILSTFAVRFPRVIFCEFEIRQQSRIHNYAVQCAITINVFTERLFISLWFWFVFLAIVTIISFLVWVFRLLNCPGHVHYVRRHIGSMESTSLENEKVSKFTKNYLRLDGMFIFRLMGMNLGNALAGEIIYELWNKHYSYENVSKQKEKLKMMEESIA